MKEHEATALTLALFIIAAILLLTFMWRAGSRIAARTAPPYLGKYFWSRFMRFMDGVQKTQTIPVREYDTGVQRASKLGTEVRNTWEFLNELTITKESILEARPSIGLKKLDDYQSEYNKELRGINVLIEEHIFRSVFPYKVRREADELQFTCKYKKMDIVFEKMQVQSEHNWKGQVDYEDGTKLKIFFREILVYEVEDFTSTKRKTTLFMKGAWIEHILTLSFYGEVFDETRQEIEKELETKKTIKEKLLKMPRGML